MTEKKELIQQLKETDPDTYKQYRLEYMKSLFDLKKFPVSVLEEQSIQDMDGRLYEKAFK